MAKRFMGLGFLAVVTVAAVAAVAACGGDSDDDSTSGTCATLTTCCPQVKDPTSQAECKDIVALANDTTCGETQEAYVHLQACVVATATSTATTGCAGLTACCSSVSSEFTTECTEEVTAANGVDSTCTTLLSAYQAQGMCKATTTTTSSGGTGCAGLTSCCSSLPAGDQPACSDQVSEAGGVDATCSEALEVWHAEGLCGGSGGGIVTIDAGGGGSTGACATLTTCCGTLTGEDATACTDDVSAAGGNETICAAYVTGFGCGGGTGTGHVDAGGTTTVDSGSSSGSCSTLSDCCSSLPQEDESGCQTIVTENVESECATYVETFQASGYCK